MIKLLKIEFNKLKNYKIFWISIILYSVLFPLFFTGINNLQFNDGLKRSVLGAVYTFPNLWHNITYFAGWFNILLYLIMILLVTNEYIYKTLRQNIIDGLSKAEVLLGKLLLGTAFSVYSTLLIIVVGLLSNYFLAPDSFKYELITQKLDFIGAYFLQTLGYMTFAIFISFLFKRQGFSIIFFLIYVTMLENIVALKLPPNVSKYLPIEMFGNLILNPFSTYINGYTQNSIDPSYIVISILYIFIFSGITLLMLEKTDI